MEKNNFQPNQNPSDSLAAPTAHEQAQPTSVPDYHHDRSDLLHAVYIGDVNPFINLARDLTRRNVPVETQYELLEELIENGHPVEGTEDMIREAFTKARKQTQHTLREQHIGAGAMRGVDVDEINDHLSSGESVYLPDEQLEYYLEEMDRREKTSELQDA